MTVDYAIGLFEGEGTVCTFPVTKNTSWKRKDGTVKYGNVTTILHYCAAIQMTDVEPLERFHAAVGGLGRITGPYSRPKDRRKHAPYWQWQVSKKSDIEKLYEILKPMLSARRIKQFERSLTMTLDDFAALGE
jgi:hypothetical protein